MRSVIKFGFLFFLISAVGPLTDADVRIKSRTSVSGGQSFESATYIKGKRERSEQSMGAVQMVTITQCDLRRSIQLMPVTRTYKITPFATADEETNEPTKVEPSRSGPMRRGGVVTYLVDVIDTGERRQMFGLTARHLKITTTWDSSPDACNRSRGKIEEEGWYADFDYDFDCERGPRRPMQPMRADKPDCVDRVRFRTTGAGRRGYPLVQTVKFYDEGGQVISTIMVETLELSVAQLEPALFEIPPGYREVQDEREMFAGLSPQMKSGESEIDSTQAMASAPQANPAGFTSASAPKREGIMRIGLALPRAQVSGGDPHLAAEGLRNSFASYLKGPSVEVIALDARLPVQALEEAKQKQCDFVLFSEMAVKKGKGGGLLGKALGNAAGAAVWNIPYGNTAGEAAARAATVATVYTAADVARDFKTKDEVSLDYKLQKVDGTIVATNGLKAKVQADGEDVISPMVEKSSEGIVTAIRK